MGDSGQGAPAPVPVSRLPPVFRPDAANRTIFIADAPVRPGAGNRTAPAGHHRHGPRWSQSRQIQLIIQAQRFRLNRRLPTFEPKADFFPDTRKLIHGSIMNKRSHRIFAGINLLLTKRLYGATVGSAGHSGRPIPMGTRAMRLPSLGLNKPQAERTRSALRTRPRIAASTPPQNFLAPARHRYASVLVVGRGRHQITLSSGAA